MKAYKCDLCGSFFTDEASPIQYSIMANDKKGKYNNDIEAFYALTKLDLCYNCQYEIDLARKHKRGIRAVEPSKEE